MLAHEIHTFFVEAYQGRYHWIEEDISRALQHPYHYLFALKDNGKYVAIAHFQMIQDAAELMNFAVAQNQQNQRLGRQFLDTTMKQLCEKGMKCCFLEVREQNNAAQRVYTHVGFQRLATRKNYYSDNQENAVIYQWKEEDYDNNFSC